MSDEIQQKETRHQNKKRLAGGAAIVFLGRMGALVEAASIIAFTWLYGVTNFGLYALFWSLILIATPLAQTAMPLALQRFVPKGDKAAANKIIGFALKWSFMIAVLIAALISFNADTLALRMEAQPEDIEQMTMIIRFFVWVLPLWVLVEVATAAIRALFLFGPEMRVRILYEQGFRLLLGLTFALLGYKAYGLFLAHFISVALTALFALHLISKYLRLRKVIWAPMTGETPKAMLKYARPITLAWWIKSLFSELPVLFLNFFLPGARGLDAAAFYKVARQITSVLQMIGVTFEYVMAPFAAEKAGKTDHKGLQDMFAYAVRLSTVIALPFAAALILASRDILAIMKPEFMVIMPAIIVLSVGRMVETLAGTSTAIIDMLGHRFLPLVNFLIGLTVMTVLSAYLIPRYDVLGGAIAAAFAMNITAILAFGEAIFLFKLKPYDRSIARPLLLSLLTTAMMIVLISTVNDLPPPFSILSAVAGLMASLFIVVRYGLNPEDAAALGPLARFSKRHKKALKQSEL